MKKNKVGYALCGSFCTIKKSLEQLKFLTEKFDITPITSQIVYDTDTRFISAEELKNTVCKLTGKEIIHTVKDAEPIGPKKLLDLLIVCPCTGNTLNKLANGITDTAVTMAVKAHLRNDRPVVLCIATNDALSASAVGIGKLLNTKNIYFVPFCQDDAENKPTSLVADFSKLYDTAICALKGEQIKPLIV